jgi:hypothetical protein
MSSDQIRCAVLHALRLASVGTVEEVVGRSGLDQVEVTAALAESAGAGWVTEQTGRLVGWSLTAAGRTEGEHLLSAQLTAHGGQGAVESGYRRFFDINQPFLDLCTRWQLIEVDGETGPNRHDDAAYDAAVLADLTTMHEVVVRISDDLGAALERFGGYRPRFEHAMSRLEANDVDWFTKPLIDSYHTVWFELHEDLLATLGRDRTSERSSGAQTEGKS